MKYIKVKPIQLKFFDFLILTCLINTVCFNIRPLQYVFHHFSGTIYDTILFTISIGIIITAVFLIFLLPFYIINVVKHTTIFLLFIAGTTSYFSNRFGILYDETLIKSLFSTDTNEFIQYWNIKILIYLLFLSFLVFYFSVAIIIKPETLKVRFLTSIKLLTGSLIFILAFTVLQYKDISSFLRNNRHLRQMVLPMSPIYEVSKYIKQSLLTTPNQFVRIGDDAKKTNPNKQIFVFVLGETARGDHFSINGYTKNNTTPLLSKRNIMTFKHVSSCGTATAVSVPCIFSSFGRASFSEEKAKTTGNILDVAEKANYETIWIDNNSGCKGVCSRSNNIDLVDFKTNKLCSNTTCFDEILVDALKKKLRSDKNLFIVLHMLGSHGPSYYLRYPEEFEKFKPSCKTSDLSSCSQEEIVNTYDNTILYTDYVIDKVIETLDDFSKKEKVNTSLLYVSDHGESLGENGIYLHSLPYMIAPEVQKNAAVIYWGADNSTKSLTVNQKMISHDYIFSSVLNILNISTKEYNKNLDFFNN